MFYICKISSAPPYFWNDAGGGKERLQMWNNPGIHYVKNAYEDTPPPYYLTNYQNINIQKNSPSVCKISLAAPFIKEKRRLHAPFISEKIGRSLPPHPTGNFPRYDYRPDSNSCRSPRATPPFVDAANKAQHPTRYSSSSDRIKKGPRQNDLPGTFPLLVFICSSSESREIPLYPSALIQRAARRRPSIALPVTPEACGPSPRTLRE